MRALILALWVLQCFSSVESKELPSREKILHHLVKVMIEPKMAVSMRKGFLEKIQAGLNLSNRKIFEELLAEAKSNRRQEIIRKYQGLEEESNAHLKQVFDAKINLLKILREMNRLIYSKHFSDEELMTLYRFYSSSLGRKFVKVSAEMVLETQQEIAKTLLPLSMQVSQEVQQRFFLKIIGLFEEDLEIEP
jgi:hypothetical protein